MQGAYQLTADKPRAGIAAGPLSDEEEQEEFQKPADTESRHVGRGLEGILGPQDVGHVARTDAMQAGHEKTPCKSEATRNSGSRLVTGGGST